MAAEFKSLILLLAILLGQSFAHGATCVAVLDTVGQRNVFFEDLDSMDQVIGTFNLSLDVPREFLNRFDEELKNPENLEAARELLPLEQFETWAKAYQAKHPEMDHIGSIFHKIAGTNEPETTSQLQNQFSISLSREAQFTMNKLASPNYTKTRKAVEKTLDKLKQDPKYQSLGTHDYDSQKGPDGQKVHSSYAQKGSEGYRVLWYSGPHKSEITILKILPHDEYDRL